MSNPYLPLVNQKMAYIRQLLSFAKADPENLSQRQSNAAIADAACLELAVAYRCFLRELASHYRVANPQAIDSALVALQGVEALSVASPEVQECNSLEQLQGGSESWLADTLHYAAQALNPVPTADDVKSQAAVQLISAVDLSKGGQESLTAAAVKGWFIAFCELVERHREGLQEF
ncbi:hypothetical protein R50073_22770 [Maricurvus nonylphenolicus]|uniref:DUF6586 family protein n=1 Tax=Maricurvus nonylphenolicus TaxID=1008307 RepID=UPI0036F28162